ncbi:hypothetical protein [Lactiplantibacillus herbarum]|uniref:hypothetical protein n=1 Tax=Lactiplantibacillus herbarum TaxID=1670446 RepID=UPI00064E73A7|nr:hypothetical protein [Lactiplantibacillus herbarum]
MQNNSLAIIVSGTFMLVILYLIVVCIVLLFLRSFHISAARFHLRTRLRIRKNYFSEPMKNELKIRKAFIIYWIVAVLTLLGVFWQVYVMTDGYPVEAAVGGCILYALEWWSTRAIYLLRDYWENHDTKAAGFTLAPAGVFKTRMVLFKSTIIATTIMTLSFMTYMLNFGVYY